MAQTAGSPSPPEPGGKLRLSRRAKAIIVGLALVEAALLLIFALPHWGEQRALAGESGSRAEKQRAPRHGPAGKDKKAADDKADSSASADESAGADESGAAGETEATDEAGGNSTGEDGKVSKDPEKLEALKKKLTDEQVNICFLKGTEPPFSGKYYRLKDPGEYRCAVCGLPLFESETKFDSGTGWPSFWDMAFPGAVSEAVDNSHGMQRIEVTCSACGSHLGHVFPDGPEPSGLRYCINSLSLEFIPAEELAREKAQKEGHSDPPVPGSATPGKES